MTVVEMREARAKLIHDARAAVSAADEAKRDLTADESKKFDSMLADADKLKAKIDTEERLLDLEADLKKPLERRAEPDTPGDPVKVPDREQRTKPTEHAEMVIGRDSRGTERRFRPTGPQATDEYRGAFSRYLRGGMPALTRADLDVIQSAGGETRALQADYDPGGGFLQASQQFVGQLIKGIDDLLFLRQLATVLPPVTTNEGVGAPSLDTDFDDATWTGEITSVSEDTAMVLGKRELRPTPITKLVKVSMKLLRSAALSIDTIIRDRLAYKFALTQEKGFLTGTGANQALGVFTASDLGISTGRDVSTGNTTTTFTADGLIECKFALKGGYWANAQWIFHRDAVKMLTKLKDGEGQYIWRTSIQAGEPDTLLGHPVNMSENAPNTFTTGLYVGILGDFSHYWIIDSLGLTVQVLNELYARTSQIGYIGRAECDGMPVLEEAFSRVTLA